MRFPNRFRCRCFISFKVLLVLLLVSFTNGRMEAEVLSTREDHTTGRRHLRQRRRLFSYTINNELESTYDPPPRVIMEPFRLTLSTVDTLLSDQNREVLLERMETVATNFLRKQPLEDGTPTLQYVKFGGIGQEMMTSDDFSSSDLLVNVDVGVASYENHPTPSSDQVQQWVEQALASELAPSLQAIPVFSTIKSIGFALQSEPVGGAGDRTTGDEGTAGPSNTGATGGGGETITGSTPTNSGATGGGQTATDGTSDPLDNGSSGGGGETTTGSDPSVDGSAGGGQTATDGTSDPWDSASSGGGGERTTGSDPSVEGSSGSGGETPTTGTSDPSVDGTAWSGGETSTNGTSDPSVDETAGNGGETSTNGETSAGDGTAPTSNEIKATETETDAAASSNRRSRGRLIMWIILGVSMALFSFGFLFLCVAVCHRRRRASQQGGGIVEEIKTEPLPASGSSADSASASPRGGLGNGSSHLDTRSVAESESEWTVATEAGDSMAIKSIHPTGSALAMTPNPTTSELAMSESFERDRQVAISKDMLTGKWSGNLTNPSGKAAGTSESVLQPSHFNAATEEQEREARAAVTPDLEASSMGSSTTDGSAESNGSGHGPNKQPRWPHPPDDDDE